MPLEARKTSWKPAGGADRRPMVGKFHAPAGALERRWPESHAGSPLALTGGPRHRLISSRPSGASPKRQKLLTVDGSQTESRDRVATSRP